MALFFHPSLEKVTRISPGQVTRSAANQSIRANKGSEENFKHQFQNANQYRPEDRFLFLGCLLWSISLVLTGSCGVSRIGSLSKWVLIHSSVRVHPHLKVAFMVWGVSINSYPHRALEVRRYRDHILTASDRLQLIVVKAWMQSGVGHVQVRIPSEALHPENNFTLVVQPQVAVIPGSYLALDYVQKEPLLRDVVVFQAFYQGHHLGRQDHQQGAPPGSSHRRDTQLGNSLICRRCAGKARVTGLTGGARSGDQAACNWVPGTESGEGGGEKG